MSLPATLSISAVRHTHTRIPANPAESITSALTPAEQLSTRHVSRAQAFPATKFTGENAPGGIIVIRTVSQPDSRRASTLGFCTRFRGKYVIALTTLLISGERRTRLLLLKPVFKQIGFTAGDGCCWVDSLMPQEMQQAYRSMHY